MYFISLFSFAQESLEVSVKFTTQEINIDGFENEKDWETWTIMLPNKI